jgi:acetylornithine deacetylase
VLQIERRTVPGETEAQVVGEVQAILDEVAAADPAFQATVRPLLTRGPWAARDDSPIAAAVESAAVAVLGHAPARTGAPYWMDAALMGDAGIDAVVLGPTGAGAHAAEEWVDLESVRQTAEILAKTAMGFCG